MHLFLSKEPYADYKEAWKHTTSKNKREEDKRFKPPDLDQHIHQDVPDFNLIKEEPPDESYKPKPSRNNYGIRLLLFDQFLCANLLCFNVSGLRNASGVSRAKDETDLRSNPSQVGEDDMIMASSGSEEIEELVPELEEVKECNYVDTTEWMPSRGCLTDDLNIPLGPMTRSKQASFNQTFYQFLYTIQGSLECAYPTTLVVIQAV